MTLPFLSSLKTDSVTCHKWIIDSELCFFVEFNFVVVFIPQAAIHITTCSSFSSCDWDYVSQLSLQNIADQHTFSNNSGSFGGIN